MPFLSSVHLNDIFRVNGEVLVGIYDYTEESRVCLQRRRGGENLLTITILHSQIQTAEPQEIKMALNSTIKYVSNWSWHLGVLGKIQFPTSTKA